jgi:hypothetical protein
VGAGEAAVRARESRTATATFTVRVLSCSWDRTAAVHAFSFRPPRALLAGKGPGVGVGLGGAGTGGGEGGGGIPPLQGAVTAVPAAAAQPAPASCPTAAAAAAAALAAAFAGAATSGATSSAASGGGCGGGGRTEGVCGGHGGPVRAAECFGHCALTVSADKCIGVWALGAAAGGDEGGGEGGSEGGRGAGAGAGAGAGVRAVPAGGWGCTRFARLALLHAGRHVNAVQAGSAAMPFVAAATDGGLVLWTPPLS